MTRDSRRRRRRRRRPRRRCKEPIASYNWIIDARRLGTIELRCLVMSRLINSYN